MNKRIIIPLVLLAVVVGISSLGISMADETSEIQSDDRPWVMNMINHGNDPTTKPGYNCGHGHMSFGC